MAIDLLRRLHQARPFRPFRIHLADGREFNVPHPELLAISPGGRRLTLYIDEGWFEHIEVGKISHGKTCPGKRVASLQRDFGAIKQRLDSSPTTWRETFGMFGDDPEFEEVVRLGKHCRRKQRPPRTRRP